MNNELIGLANEAKHKPNALVAGLLVFTMVGGLPSLFVSFNNKVLDLAIGSLMIAFAGASLMCFLYVKFVEKRPIRSMGFQKESALSQYGKGLFIGFIMFAGVYFLASLSGGISYKFAFATAHFPSIFIILLGFIIQGATEEILFRGWMLPVLGARYNIPFAVIVSSVGFMLLHGLNFGITALSLINLFMFGLFAALYALREKSLWGICAWHGVWNWAQGSVFGIEVSGTNVSGGSILISKSIEGKELLSGGNFGIEGSIVCTVILGLASVYLLMKLRGEND